MKRLIIKIASEEGIDPALALAVAEQESGFNPNARNKTSKEDSIGLFQINRMAHPDYKGGADPEANIRYGVRYLKGQLARAKGNVPLALAAYNGGWGGKNSSQAKAYARQAFGRIGKYQNVSNNEGEIAQNINGINRGVVTGGAADYGVDVLDPTRPNYKPLMTAQNSVAVNNGEGLPQGRLTGDELMAIKAITSPVQVPQDVRPDVTIGQDENGNLIRVTASQYNQMLNEIDAQRMIQMRNEIQARLPELAKTEVQLDGQNAYDTLKGLRDEYNQSVANDPRWDLVRLTPEQARLVASDIRNDFDWGGNSRGLTREQMYQMLNSLEKYQTPLTNAYDLTDKGYTRQLDNMKEFQNAALTLAQGNQELAQNLIQQAVAGDKNAIDALQKTLEARIKQETDIQKQIQSDYGTQLNTQQQGKNTFYTNLPTARKDQNQYINTYDLTRYGTDVKKYDTDLKTKLEMAKPQLQSDVDARDPIKLQQLAIDEGKLDVARRNANTAEAAAAGNYIINSGLNREGADKAAGAVPSIRNMMGNPNANMRQAIFGTALPYTTPQATLADFTKLFNGD